MEDRIYQNIIAYLDGTLTEADRQAFEAEMRRNSELAQEVSLTREVLHAIHEPKVQELRSQLNSIMKEELRVTAPDHKTVPLFPIRRLLSVAAVFALLTVFFFWLTDRQKTEPSLQQENGQGNNLYASYFPPPNQLIPEDAFTAQRNTTSQNTGQTETAVRNLRETINRLYDEKNYEAALSALNKLPSLDKSLQFYDPADFFTWQGILLLQLDRSSEALSSFESSEKYRQTEAGSWYTVAALLAQNRKDKAKYLLKGIAANSRDPHANQARELLKLLK
jgi:hypothetical protein